MAKFEVYLNVEDVYSFEVEAENREAVDDLIQEMFDEYGTDFYAFLHDDRTDKCRHDVMSDYQIDILEIIPQHKVDDILQKNITDRMKWEDLND
tara:strand:- start:305 stop:586 length:282 start_codon:yes stop_codon:yes gene_type:complete